MKCVYCGKRRAANKDHVVPKARLARAIRDATLGYRTDPLDKMPEWVRDTVGSCWECNVRKGARLLAPPAWGRRIKTLNRLGLGTFQVWDGGTIPEVLK